MGSWKTWCWLVLAFGWELLSAGSDVQLNEILFQSTFPTRPVMIELKNAGSETIDVGGYTLADAYGNFFSLPEKTVIAPEGLLVVVFADGDREMLYLEPAAAADTSSRWVFCRDAELNQRIFQEKRAQWCRLYSSDAMQPEVLIDKVSWGNNRYFKTLLPGNWNVADINTVFYCPGERALPLDCSLAAFNDASGHRQWQMTRENTLGEINPPPPPPPFSMSPSPSVAADSPEPVVPDQPVAVHPGYNLCISGASGMGYMSPSFRWKCKFLKGSFFRLQISRDPDFLTMVREEELAVRWSDFVSFLTFELEPGRYYWRVRKEYDGQLGAWSPVYSMLIVQRD